VRADGRRVGCLLHPRLLCCVWLPNKALCIRRRYFPTKVAYLLERGRSWSFSPRAHYRVWFVKIKKNSGRTPTRFERVTFAFRRGSGQPTARRPLTRHKPSWGFEPVVDLSYPIAQCWHQFLARGLISASGPALFVEPFHCRVVEMRGVCQLDDIAIPLPFSVLDSLRGETRGREGSSGISGAQ